MEGHPINGQIEGFRGLLRAIGLAELKLWWAEHSRGLSRAIEVYWPCGTKALMAIEAEGF